jgi:hypothetical protein
MTRAGTPPTRVQGSTSRVTTACAATTDPRPTLTPGKMIPLVAIQTSSSMTTGIEDGVMDLLTTSWKDESAIVAYGPSCTLSPSSTELVEVIVTP